MLTLILRMYLMGTKVSENGANSEKEVELTLRVDC